MSNNIEASKVVEYIKNTIEPVRYDVLRSKFCGSKSSDESKKSLHDVLLSEVKSGNILHYNDHFYASSSTKDLTDCLEEDGDVMSDDSQISISSCESDNDDNAGDSEKTKKSKSSLNSKNSEVHKSKSKKK